MFCVTLLHDHTGHVAIVFTNSGAIYNSILIVTIIVEPKMSLQYVCVWYSHPLVEEATESKGGHFA